MRAVRILWAASLLVGLALIGLACSSDDPVTGSGQGTLTVSVHDQVPPNLTVAEVTFSSVEVHQVGGDWVAATGALPRTVDLLQFVGEGNATALAQDLVPAGTYDQVRLGISAVHLEFHDGTSVDVTLPSGGVHVAVAVTFTVGDGTQTAVSLDFDPGTAFKLVGNGWVVDGSGVVASGVR